MILTSHPDPRGVPLGGRQGAREKESNMSANHDHTAFRDKYETREKAKYFSPSSFDMNKITNA